MTTWRVPLPKGAERPYRVFVNGVPQQEGRDYKVSQHQLLFEKPLEKEKIGVGSWTAMFLGLWGRYGKNDSVDVHYQLHGRTIVATRLDILAPKTADKP